MLDFDELGEKVVNVLRRNDSFVDSLGPGELSLSYYRYSYPDMATTGQAIEQLRAPGALLVYGGTQLVERSNGIIHTFSLVVAPRGPMGRVLKALRDGVIRNGDGLPLKFYQFQPEGHQIDVTGCQLRPILIGDRSVIEFHEVFLQVTETGTDN